MQSSINNTTTITSNGNCYKQQCSRIDVINQIIAKKQNTNNNQFQVKFQQFYRDRMQLNKIQKKDKLELHDQILRLYKSNQVAQQINLTISSQEKTFVQSFSKPMKMSIDRRRPRSQSTHRSTFTSPKTTRPILKDVLRISPKYISNRTTISSRNDTRSIRKNIFLDALILQQDSQDLF
ncbi:unnamed protein product (macronuclear) [Paramecium tetraurelia]|uniref:Uncharacterized protein n=1 Tax=Paramecium tetraurelia TaxID=5888 RepID=A0CVL2_PARTE|nr:uncharacterized protein GSPATT00010997001 [Paramecium tetraurelia]CAK74829.1 unnamed protein product [Paramecium tetraurelia]|eukprot:XP_001442226.1 hypothetical protein (macronuclear) [Paramecium tetraurelia strain d4-2]